MRIRTHVYARTHARTYTHARMRTRIRTHECVCMVTCVRCLWCTLPPPAPAAGVRRVPGGAAILRRRGLCTPQSSLAPTPTPLPPSPPTTHIPIYPYTHTPVHPQPTPTLSILTELLTIIILCHLPSEVWRSSSEKPPFCHLL